MKRRPVTRPEPWDWLGWTDRQEALVAEYFPRNLSTYQRLLHSATVWYPHAFNPSNFVARYANPDWPVEVQVLMGECPISLYLSLVKKTASDDTALLVELSRVILKAALVLSGNYEQSEVQEFGDGSE